MFKQNTNNSSPVAKGPIVIGPNYMKPISSFQIDEGLAKNGQGIQSVIKDLENTLIGGIKLRPVPPVEIDKERGASTTAQVDSGQSVPLFVKSSFFAGSSGNISKPIKPPAPKEIKERLQEARDCGAATLQVELQKILAENQSGFLTI
jgi:hypothetical protein